MARRRKKVNLYKNVIYCYYIRRELREKHRPLFECRKCSICDHYEGYNGACYSDEGKILKHFILDNPNILYCIGEIRPDILYNTCDIISAFDKKSNPFCAVCGRRKRCWDAGGHVK